MGVTWGANEKAHYVVEFFKKFKEAVFEGENQFYGVTGFGVSFGIKF